MATELCGSTFLPDDTYKANLAATALFAGGAACAVVCGDEADGPGLEIRGTGSRFFPDSLDDMGWTVLQEGPQVVFAQRIPEIVLETATEDVGAFLSRFDLARGVLRDFGNMSSATVLFVLERFLQTHGTGNGGHGLIFSMGPGFCSESLLVEL